MCQSTKSEGLQTYTRKTENVETFKQTKADADVELFLFFPALKATK